MKTMAMICTLGVISVLAAACAVQPAGGEGEESNAASTSEALPYFPICFSAQPALVSTAVHPVGGLGGTVGPLATSPMPYGNSCSPDFIIEATGTKGYVAGTLEVSSTATVDAPMNTSSLACAVSTITVEAWGRLDTSCTTSETGICSTWQSLGANTQNGIWQSGVGGGFSFPPHCSLGASLPGVFNSQYSAIRLGARAAKTTIVGSATVKTPLPVTSRIGYTEIGLY